MQNRTRGNEYRTTIVCIDSYEDSVLSGWFYNPSLKAGERFESLTQYLLKMENTLDSMQLPQSFTTTRAFASPTPPVGGSPPDREPQEGKLATFAVRILFRQNASWQGSVTWLEEGMEESFRSVLELILLMDSALTKHRPTAQKQVPAFASSSPG